MGCQKHQGILPWWPDQRHSPTCSAQRVDTPSPARSANCDKNRYRRRNASFSRKVPVFHRRQLGLLGANAAAATEVLSPGGGGGGGGGGRSGRSGRTRSGSWWPRRQEPSVWFWR
jgi:hypothetical protein